MNLAKLFEMQKVLDDHILDEHPELKAQNNLDWKTLALQVELGECANEWRGFKKWSKNQEPRTKGVCKWCHGEGTMDIDFDIGTDVCLKCDGTGVNEYENPLLEEYVDGLHFILSIGLELGFDKLFEPFLVYVDNPMQMFGNIYLSISRFSVVSGSTHKEYYYSEIFNIYLGLGKSLGFTWDEIENEYVSKNTVNHQRQTEGY